MTPLITGFIFVGIVASMFFLLTAIQAIAHFNTRKRLKRSPVVLSNTNSTGAKVIPLPRNVVKPSREKVLINEVAAEEIV
jgi:hypothetical protein